MPDARPSNVITRRVTVFLPLGSDSTAGTPLQAFATPTRDTTWDVLRVWAYSIGYEETPSETGPSTSGSTDPYNSFKGNWAAGTGDSFPGNYNPVAMIYLNQVALDALLQPFYFVPRSFEPIALQQVTHLTENDRLVFFAGEVPPSTGPSAARKARGITLGAEINETVFA